MTPQMVFTFLPGSSPPGVVGGMARFYAWASVTERRGGRLGLRPQRRVANRNGRAGNRSTDSGERAGLTTGQLPGMPGRGV